MLYHEIPERYLRQPWPLHELRVFLRHISAIQQGVQHQQGVYGSWRVTLFGAPSGARDQVILPLGLWHHRVALSQYRKVIINESCSDDMQHSQGPSA